MTSATRRSAVLLSKKKHPLLGFNPEDYILSYRKLFYQLEMLMDHADAEPSRRYRDCRSGPLCRRGRSAPNRRTSMP